MRTLKATLTFVAALAGAAHLSAQATTARPEVTRDFAAVGPVEPIPAPLAAAASSIGESALAAHVRFLASPALAGRGLGSPGLDAALEYVRAGLALAGISPLRAVAPGEPESTRYFQLVPLREIRGLRGQVIVERETGEQRWSRAFADGVDCRIPELPPQSLGGPVVFAGYGIRETRLDHDDYRGLDVRGKVVVVLGGLPPGQEWRAPELVERYDPRDEDDRFRARLDAARAAGAAALLAVDLRDWPPLAYPSSRARAPFFLPFDALPPDGTPLLRISPSAAEAILEHPLPAGSGAALDRPAELRGVSVTIEVGGEETLATSRNVVGVIAGADAALRDEAVVLGAHVDHLGAAGGVVYPGADDNASGVAALLEIARAFAAAPERPRRTVVFAFWTGEEEGKLGSGYFVRHPLWPLARTVAYLNLDMIGHPWSANEIRTLVTGTGLPGGEAFLAGLRPTDFVEPGLPPDAPRLEQALRRAARGTGLALHLDRTSGIHGGSDYRDFARAGVPFIRFFGNFFPDYHEPGDTADRLDAGQVQRVARLALATAWLLANP